MQEFDILNILNDPNNLLLIGFLVSVFLFLIEGYKYLKYKTKSDVMDLSLLAAIFLSSFIIFDDLYLSFLAVVFFLMIIGTYELRESPVWVRLMASFTITYGYLLLGVIIARTLDILVANNLISLPSWLERTEQISGFALSTTLWVLLIFSFAFFGKRFILVSRFLSPQYVYMFLYAVVYLVILLAEGVPWEYRFIGLLIVNVFLYLISGWLLTFIFGIRPLNDERSLNIVRKIEGQINTKIRAVGIVEAPILNAFAYGPFFDQRFAFIVKDINEFTDEELQGITAHEISHLKGKHTFWLLWIGFFDLLIRYILNVPVSSYDIAAGLTDWNLFDYYIVNMLFFAFALLFIRLMEGNADKRTKEVGYGNELSQALYRLEGYYRGIAGELGLNAQLLTDSTRTESEERRFTGEAAIEMHNRLLNPSRSGLFMNLIVSHPPTPFRIAAMISDDISPKRLSLLPILLILPFTRKRNLKLLKKSEEALSQRLTKAYNMNHDSVKNYVDTTYLKHFNDVLLNRGVLLKPKKGIKSDKEYITGKLIKTEIVNNIVDPIQYTIQTENGEVVIPSKNYSVQVFEKDSFYILKNKKIGILKSVQKDKKGKYQYLYDIDGKETKLKYLGIHLDDFKEKNLFILNSRGKTKFIDLFESLELKNPFESEFIIDLYNNNTKSFKAKNLLFSLPPVVLVFYKRFKEENKNFTKDLIKKNIFLTLYTSKDPDIGIPCLFKEITDDNEIEYISPGEEKNSTILLKQLDAIVIKSNCIVININSELGIFNKLFSRLSNRGSTLKYI